MYIERQQIVEELRLRKLIQQAIRIVENKKRTLFSSHVYHEYKGKQVVGYICGG